MNVAKLPPGAKAVGQPVDEVWSLADVAYAGQPLSRSAARFANGALVEASFNATAKCDKIAKQLRADFGEPSQVDKGFGGKPGTETLYWRTLPSELRYTPVFEQCSITLKRRVPPSGL